MGEQLEEELLVPPYRLKDAATRNDEDFVAGSRTDDPRFLRNKSSIPARRKVQQRRLNTRWLRVALVILALTAIGTLGWATRSFLRHDARFLLNRPAAIEFQGSQIVTRPQVIRIFAQDIGHSVFAVPLKMRRSQIERIPWVQSATVMRLWPNRLRVAVVERAPVAYVRDGNTIRVVDADGVLLDMPPGGLQNHSFPIVTGVVTGIASHSASDTRAAKMQLYLQFMAALDAGGSQISQAVSEVDVSDSEDVRAVIADGASEILVHFGDSDFLAHYQVFAAHRAEWLRQYPHLASVDMRYGRQVVLDMGASDGAGQQATQPTTTTDAASVGKN